MGSEKKIYRNKVYDAERSLYGLRDADVEDCVFAGPADGESVLKECHRFDVKGCRFSLRYPLWHAKDFSLTSSSMDELTRAALWYDERGRIENCDLSGIKALRARREISLKDCRIVSPEFGWKCDGIELRDSEISAEYLFLDSKNIKISGIKMKGKYSFQYTENVLIEDSDLDTKDAFWHSKNVTVKNCRVAGEYPAWFSDGLTLIDCDISGTQPFCYCRNLTLINCRMSGTDLAFEYSDVNADIIGRVESVKNPRSGIITLDEVGEIITESPVEPCFGKVVLRG